MNRRGFLKLAGAVGSLLPLYTWAKDVGEPKGLIQDVGDYYRIAIPDGGVLRQKEFNKPALILLGRDAVMADVMVYGFTNVVAVGNGVLKSCGFDCSKMRFDRPVNSLTITGGRVVLLDTYSAGPAMD